MTIVRGGPQVVLLAVYLDEHLIEIKRIAKSTMSLLELASVCRSELDTPQSDRLIADRDALLCQQVFDITEAQVETVVDPYRVANNAEMKAVSFVGTHDQIIPTRELTCQYPTICLLEPQKAKSPSAS
ncbi:MAG: hypothetical protein ACI87C_000837 [Paraperlucidibaca sp.]|jgi:hypothetical protein